MSLFKREESKEKWKNLRVWFDVPGVNSQHKFSWIKLYEKWEILFVCVDLNHSMRMCLIFFPSEKRLSVVLFGA